jgi:tetratricopeptide (TPR) repeat protein
MSRAVERGSIILGIALLLIALSCAHERREPATEQQEKERIHIDVQNAISSAQHNVAIDDYQKALDILNNTYAKYRKNGALRSGYIRIIEEIKNDAEASFKNKRFAVAGTVYNILLRDSFRITDIADAVSFDREFLKNRIKTCARILTQDGLIKYREGELDEAIAIWKRVLAFDRDNIEVKNAISTAQNQLRNLKKTQ